MKLTPFALVAIVILFMLNTGNAQTVTYSYSPSGKMTQRSIQVANFRLANPFQKDSTVKQLDFQIYPNPTNSFLTVEGKLPDNVGQAKINITNMSGQVLKTDTYNGQAKNIAVDDLKPGLYLLEVSYARDGKSIYKIIITN